MTRLRRTAAALATAVLLTGCGTVAVDGSTPGGQASRTAPAPTPVPAACPSDVEAGTADYATLPRLPASVTPVAVLRCTTATEDDAAGRWAVVRTERATEGLAAYVAALRLADEPTPTEGYGCTDDLRLLPWMAVELADGRALRVGTPVTACGKPLPAVIAALDGLRFTTTGTTRGERLLTPDQLAAQNRADALGCSSEFKDMVAVEAGDGPDDGTRPLLSSTPDTLLLCRYSVDPESSEPVGTFVAGVRLDPAATRRAVEALATSTPATGTCAARHTDLVGLYDGGWVLVELDGCGRAASETGALRVLPPTAIAALSTLAATAS